MNFSRRALMACATLALAILGCPGQASAATKSVAYYAVAASDIQANGFGVGVGYAYLIDWKGQDKARVVNSRGVQPGAVSDNGTQRLVTLDAPLSGIFFVEDACHMLIERRMDIERVVVRDLKGGATQIAEIGTWTNIGGCQDGLVTPFGSETDPGISMKRVAMNARPTMTDMVPGVQIAGPSEEPYLSQDVITLGEGTALFHATGRSVPVAWSSDQWLVFDMDGFERAYTRLEVNAKTAREIWMVADWSAGQAESVMAPWFVKPLAGAGFGSVAQASRMWQSGMSSQPFFVYLYKDGTGETVLEDPDQGTDFRSPITWGFDGPNVVQTGVNFPNKRIWMPLRNEGKRRWVFEYEVYSGGYKTPTRVIDYVDTGKAVPPSR